ARTEAHGGERRLGVEGGGVGGGSPCVVVQEPGFAASAARGAGGGGKATVLVRPLSVRTSVAKGEMEPASEPVPPLLASSFSTSPLLPVLRAEASSASA